VTPSSEVHANSLVPISKRLPAKKRDDGKTQKLLLENKLGRINIRFIGPTSFTILEFKQFELGMEHSIQYINTHFVCSCIEQGLKGRSDS